MKAPIQQRQKPEKYQAPALKLEFCTIAKGQTVTWRLRLCKNGPIVMRSTEKWTGLKQARLQTGLFFKALFANQFEVFDLTRSQAKETRTEPNKTPTRSSKAGA
jgi:hypothetical protein